MTPAFSARRRADEFEALVNRTSDSPLTGREAERFADLLTVVDDLRSVPEVAPRPDFVADLRERLMAEADTVLVPGSDPPAATTHPRERLALPVRSRRRDRRLAVVLSGALLAGATTTVAVAAQTALPGESLYGVKRALESVERRFATDDAARGRSLLSSAERRLTELEALAADDPAGADTLVPDTLDEFTDQSEQGVDLLLDAYAETGDRAMVEDVRAFTAESMQRLEQLEDELPASARDELLAAGRRLSDLDAAAAAACPVCGGGITEMPDFLLTSALPTDLLTGLDRDDVQLDPAPVSGLDVGGIEVPAELQVPTTDGSQPAGTQQPDPTQGVGDGVKDTLDGAVKDTVKGTGDAVEDTTETVTGATGGVVSGADQATGGAVGGLVDGVDDATGGLIGDVTGTLDQTTGGVLDDATGGVLP